MSLVDLQILASELKEFKSKNGYLFSQSSEDHFSDLMDDLNSEIISESEDDRGQMARTLAEVRFENREM